MYNFTHVLKVNLEASNRLWQCIRHQEFDLYVESRKTFENVSYNGQWVTVYKTIILINQSTW